jgi:hypothetical protein
MGLDVPEHGIEAYPADLTSTKLAPAGKAAA